MKSEKVRILIEMPLNNPLSSLTNTQISQIFGLSKPVVSNIIASKFLEKQHEEEDKEDWEDLQLKLHSDGSFIELKETNLYKKIQYERTK